MDLQSRHRDGAHRPLAAVDFAGHNLRGDGSHLLSGPVGGQVSVWRSRQVARAWIDGVLTLPLVLPPTVVGFFLLLLLGRRSFIGHALEQIGVVIVFSWPATVIAATVVAFPLMYRTTLGAFEQVNPNLLDAARTLGASEGTVFRRVLLPMAAPGVLAGTVLAFARAMGEFGATLMLAGNIPGRTQTMPIAIFSAAEGGDMQRGISVGESDRRSCRSPLFAC
jgi:molybdate ABC transporter permease protein